METCPAGWAWRRHEAEQGVIGTQDQEGFRFLGRGFGMLLPNHSSGQK